MRVFLTSRPELPIRLEFKNISADAHQDVVLQDIPETTIEHDIFVYLTYELAKIRKEYNDRRSSDLWLPLDWPGDEKIQALTTIAAPLFIFAATVCRFVGNRKRDPKRRLARFLELIASHASSLERTYLPVLQQLMDGCPDEDKEDLAKEFREIVGPVLILADPLSASSLARLLAISQEDIHTMLDDLHSVLSIPSDRDSPIRLLHLSFRDFLGCKKEAWFSVDEMKTHGMIAAKCRELMSSCLKENICGLHPPGKLRQEIDVKTLDDCLPRDIRYASQYWIHHLKESGGQISDHDAVHEFLKRHFLHWLEVLSLVGKISESIGFIDSLLGLVEVSFPSLECSLRMLFYNELH